MGLSAYPLHTSDGLRLEAKSSFRVFNTDVQVTLADWQHSHLLPRVEAHFRRFEARFSRFLTDSELSRFNRRTEPAVAVSDGMHDLLAACLEFHRETEGIFNPLIIDNLEAAGYDASFERLPTQPRAAKTLPALPPSLDCLELDLPGANASLPLGLRLDFGGIGKGYAVDQAASLLAETGGFLLDAGGDIYAARSGPQGEPWRIEVADPAAPDDSLDVVSLVDQAIATSWTTKRRWRAGDGWAHHLIDPRSGRPTDGRVIGATVIASTTTQADVFAKCSLILGPEEGPAFLESRAVHGLLVLADGSLIRTSGWPAA
jgi:thiamine biosynthesis lipoprotein